MEGSEIGPVRSERSRAAKTYFPLPERHEKKADSCFYANESGFVPLSKTATKLLLYRGPMKLTHGIPFSSKS